METTIVHGRPGGVATLLRAALPSIPLVNQLPGIRKSGDFEGLAFSRPAVTIERPHVMAYAGVCDFPVKDTVPLTYPHVLAFPLHMAILSDPRFPFPAVGAVHLANSITAHRPIEIGETITVTTRAEEVRPHPKGRTVDVVATIDSGGEIVWESTSTYLRRGHGDSEVRVPDGPSQIPPGKVVWPLPADLGRRYAAVSGDHNPIHLYPLTARALGFQRQIAHGMWSLARCVAAVENRLPDAVTVEATFKKPIILPGSVAFGVDPTADGGLAFALTAPKSGAPHLVGRTRSAQQDVIRPGRPGDRNV
jgi:acyl dehydratase